MKFSTTEEHKSESCPGVKFFVRRLAEGRRIAIALKLARVYDRIDQLRSESASLAESLRPLYEDAKRMQSEGDTRGAIAVLQSPDAMRAAGIQRTISQIEANEVYPEYVAALLARVEGLQIDDDEKPSPSKVIADGPRELYAEIRDAVLAELGLSNEQKGNFESPGTSTAPQPAPTNTTASGVSVTETGATVAAA